MNMETLTTLCDIFNIPQRELFERRVDDFETCLLLFLSEPKENPSLDKDVPPPDSGDGKMKTSENNDSDDDALVHVVNPTTATKQANFGVGQMFARAGVLNGKKPSGDIQFVFSRADNDGNTYTFGFASKLDHKMPTKSLIDVMGDAMTKDLKDGKSNSGSGVFSSISMEDWKTKLVKYEIEGYMGKQNAHDLEKICLSTFASEFVTRPVKVMVSLENKLTNVIDDNQHDEAIALMKMNAASNESASTP